MGQQVARAAVPQPAVDGPCRRRGLLVIAGAFLRGRFGAYPRRGPERHDIQAVQIQALAPGAEEVLPVGGFLHAEQAALVDVLTGVPAEDAGVHLPVGGGEAAADYPPQPGVGIGAEVGLAAGGVHVVRHRAAGSGRGLEGVEAAAKGVGDGLIPGEAGAEQGHHAVPRPDLVVARFPARSQQPRRRAAPRQGADGRVAGFGDGAVFGKRGVAEGCGHRRTIAKPVIKGQRGAGPPVTKI